MINTTQIQNLNLSKNLYPQTILRYKNKKKLCQLDYSFNIANLKIENLNEEEIGKSCSYPLLKLKHKKFKALQLQYFLTYQSVPESYETAINFINTTKELIDEEIIKEMKLLFPTKGGFMGYFSGLTGFIPQSHAKNLLILESLKYENENLATSLYFSQLHKKNTLLTPNCVCQTGNVSIQPGSILNNFNKRRVRRKKYFSRVFFVFLSQQIEDLKKAEKAEKAEQKKIEIKAKKNEIKNEKNYKKNKTKSKIKYKTGKF